MSRNAKTTIEVDACRANLRALYKQRQQAREHQRASARQALRAAANAVFPRFPGVHRAYLFGSVLYPGAFRSSSDVDVAVEGQLSAEEFFAVWRELEQAAAGWLIDLVELDKDVHFLRRVREKGELVYQTAYV
jgi:predicted nucleotidyltransferase